MRVRETHQTVAHDTGDKAKKCMNSHGLLNEIRTKQFSRTVEGYKSANQKDCKEAKLQGRDNPKKMKEKHGIRSKRITMTIKPTHGSIGRTLSPHLTAHRALTLSMAEEK
ncbi:hypothetical protein NDU88_011234 [Pleurodeles waltl]|uniref:Uncharacterized protein n=1 Tax=Pleurodeles waltl TaxID=8319 RepID=A0AAV7R0E3_PLEWA|nr:hypothetical protein NDU88_011234 [Pleurodeles waltl]